MTLNITVATERCIYQSADYRLRDLRTGKTFDFETQKIALINRYTWSATVCFAGVGRTQTVDVSEWLAEHIAVIEQHDPFDRLIDELLTANHWLSTIPPPHNKHSFSIGAFVGTKPRFVLISNFEGLTGAAAKDASPTLQIHQSRPLKPEVFLSGQRQAVIRPIRRRLAHLVAANPSPDRMQEALAEANREAARRNALISEACFTAYVDKSGNGGCRAHGIENRAFFPKFAVPAGFEDSIRKLLEQEYGPAGRPKLVAMVTKRIDPSDEYHETQLREKPSDPNTHSNYGAYLFDRKDDKEGAEREYRKAIQLDPFHVNALGNLANLMAAQGDKHQANELYRRALDSGRAGNENVTWNYARFLYTQLHDQQQAREVLEEGIVRHPDSGRLMLLRAELNLVRGTPLEALDDFRRARDKGAEQAAVESGYACALHMSGAPIGECIAAYRVAITLAPKNPILRLNLAQCLFIKGEDAEANKQLGEAVLLGLDVSSQLEAQFYVLAYTRVDPRGMALMIENLSNEGARLSWNMGPTIDHIAKTSPMKAARLSKLAELMTGKLDQTSLEEVLSHWPKADAT